MPWIALDRQKLRQHSQATLLHDRLMVPPCEYRIIVVRFFAVGCPHRIVYAENGHYEVPVQTCLTSLLFCCCLIFWQPFFGHHPLRYVTLSVQTAAPKFSTLLPKMEFSPRGYTCIPDDAYVPNQLLLVSRPVRSKILWKLIYHFLMFLVTDLWQR